MHFTKRTVLFAAICALGFLTFTCSDSSTGSGDGGGNGEEVNRNFSKQNPGASANAFLSGEEYENLELEIDFMPGHKPTQDALDSLKTFLQLRLNKMSITFRTPVEVSSGNKQAYTANDIRELEAEYRDHFTKAESNTLQAYFLFVDEKYEQPNVLGIAYYNTSMAFFGPTIEEASSGLGAPSRRKIEGTVFRHEFGHVMGLVGNGSPTQSSHKTSGSAHCTTDGCLMKPSVETANFFANTFDGTIPDLDQFCIADLQANGGR